MDIHEEWREWLGLHAQTQRDILCSVNTTSLWNEIHQLQTWQARTYAIAEAAVSLEGMQQIKAVAKH